MGLLVERKISRVEQMNVGFREIALCRPSRRQR